jgi:hypothetical protein
MRLGAGDTADDQPHGEPPSSLGSGMAVLRFASKTKRKLARTAEAREKDGHNKQDSVSMETHLAIVQEQLDSVSKTLFSKKPADIHGIISAFTAARRLSQKHFASDETCERALTVSRCRSRSPRSHCLYATLIRLSCDESGAIASAAQQVEARLRAADPELAAKIDLRRAAPVRSQVRRLWDLLLAQSAASADAGSIDLPHGTEIVSQEAYSYLHCCISKAISSSTDEWSLTEAVGMAETDWDEDVARFSNDASINTWLEKVKRVLQKRSDKVVAAAGWAALFKQIDSDGSGRLDCKEFMSRCGSAVSLPAFVLMPSCARRSGVRTRTAAVRLTE